MAIVGLLRCIRKQAMPKAKRAAETGASHSTSRSPTRTPPSATCHLVYDWDGPAAASRAAARARPQSNARDGAPELRGVPDHAGAGYDDAAHGGPDARSNLDPVSIRTNAFGTNSACCSPGATTRRSTLARSAGSSSSRMRRSHSRSWEWRTRKKAASPRQWNTCGRPQRSTTSPTIVGLQAHVLALAGQPETAVRLIRRLEESARASLLLPLRNRRRICDPGRPGHGLRMVPQRRRRPRRLHGVARRRALDPVLPHPIRATRHSSRRSDWIPAPANRGWGGLRRLVARVLG